MHLTIHLSDGWLDEDDVDGEAKNRGDSAFRNIIHTQCISGFYGEEEDGTGNNNQFSWAPLIMTT